MKIVPHGRRRKLFDLLIAAAVVIGIFPLLFAQSMLRGSNHDEHQHLAAGYLAATGGLLPYRDFPFFHPPNLPLIYALFMDRGDYLLLQARLFSTICAALTVGVIAWMGLKWTAGRGWRIVVAVGASFLLVASPVFAETVGRASNHDASVLLALLAACCHIDAMARARGARGWIASGILLGIAIGTRITLAPIVVPFFLTMFFWSGSGSLAERFQKGIIFGTGLFIGGLPMLVMFVLAPEGFFYGVLEFSQTNVAYRAFTGNTQTMSLLTKLRYLFRPILFENWSVALVLAGSLGMYAWQQWKLRHTAAPAVKFLLLLLPFVLLGCLAPSPLFYIYFYALAPFCVLAIVACVAQLDTNLTSSRIARWTVASLILGGVAVAVPRYARTLEFHSFQEWTPPDVHADAQDLKKYLEPGARILTLSPTRTMEAGFNIYPAFATGPFSWRVASLVDPKKRCRLGMVASEDLERYLDANPPDGILVGREIPLETAFIAYARRHRYREIQMWGGREQLWLKKMNSARGIRGDGNLNIPARFRPSSDGRGGSVIIDPEPRGNADGDGALYADFFGNDLAFLAANERQWDDFILKPDGCRFHGIDRQCGSGEKGAWGRGRVGNFIADDEFATLDQGQLIAAHESFIVDQWFHGSKGEWTSGGFRLDFPRAGNRSLRSAWTRPGMHARADPRGLPSARQAAPSRSQSRFAGGCGAGDDVEWGA